MHNVQQTKHKMRKWMSRRGLRIARMNCESPVWGLGARTNAWRITGRVGRPSTSRAAVSAVLWPLTVQEKALKLELAEVGVTEHPANSNDGPRVREYQSSTGAYKQPWCASFQSWALLGAGLKREALPSIPAYVPSWTSMIRDGSRGWKRVSFTDARPGDVVTLWESGHIEMVAAKPSGDAVNCVGGNTTSGSVKEANGGAVARTTRYRAEVTIIGRRHD